MILERPADGDPRMVASYRRHASSAIAGDAGATVDLLLAQGIVGLISSLLGIILLILAGKARLSTSACRRRHSVSWRHRPRSASIFSIGA